MVTSFENTIVNLLDDCLRCITDHSTAPRSRHPVLWNSMVGVGTNLGNFG